MRPVSRGGPEGRESARGLIRGERFARGLLHGGVREADQAAVVRQTDDEAHVGELRVEMLDRIEKARRAETSVGSDQDASARKARLELANEPGHQGCGVAVVARVAGAQAQARGPTLAIEHQQREGGVSALWPFEQMSRFAL